MLKVKGVQILTHAGRASQLPTRQAQHRQRALRAQGRSSADVDDGDDGGSGVGVGALRGC